MNQNLLTVRRVKEQESIARERLNTSAERYLHSL